MQAYRRKPAPPAPWKLMFWLCLPCALLLGAVIGYLPGARAAAAARREAAGLRDQVVALDADVANWRLRYESALPSVNGARQAAADMMAVMAEARMAFAAHHVPSAVVEQAFADAEERVRSR